MLQPIGELFSQRKEATWQASDIRLAIERFLQQELRSDNVYCVAVKGGHATIRVGSPTLYQEARLRQWDVAQALAEEIGYTLERFTIIPSYY